MSSNHTISTIDYATTLASLKAEREEIEKFILERERAIRAREELNRAIQAIENIMKISYKTSQKSSGDTLDERHKISLSNYTFDVENKRFKYNFAHLSVYEAAITLLKLKGRPLTTKEIFNGLQEGGKTFQSENPLMSMSTTLYKAVRDKKTPLLKTIGRGTWALTDRNDRHPQLDSISKATRVIESNETSLRGIENKIFTILDSNEPKREKDMDGILNITFSNNKLLK